MAKETKTPPASDPGPAWEPVDPSDYKQSFEQGLEAVMAGKDPDAAGQDEPAPTDGEEPPPKDPAQPAKPAKPVKPVKPVKPTSAAAKLAAKLKDDGQPSDTAGAADDGEPAPTDDGDGNEVIPEYKRGTTAEQWKAVHEEKASALRRAVAAEDALNRVKEESAKPYVAKLTEAQQQIDKLQGELERVAIERSPKFQAEFKQREEGLIGKLRGIVPSAEFDKVKGLMTAEPSDGRIGQLEEVMNNLSPLRQRQFADLISQHEQLVEERQNKIQSSVANWQKDQEMAVRDREGKLTEARQTFETVEKQYRDKYGATGDNDWDGQIESALAGARNDFEADLPMARLSEITVQARMAPVYANLAVKLADEIAELEGKVAKLRGAGPDPGSDTGAGEDGDGDDDVGKLIERHGSPGAAFAESARRAGVPLQ